MATGMRILLVLFVLLPGLPSFFVFGTEIRQTLGRGDFVEMTSGDELPALIVQSSPRLSAADRHGQRFTGIGFHVHTGVETEMYSEIRMHDLNTSHLIGARGKGTHVRYRGRWEAGGGNAFPHLFLNEGARFTFEAESEMNLTLQGSLFTRHLWVSGDGTGTLELAEGFVSDRTRHHPVADAMGAIRLHHVTLVTHHTRSLPNNLRPDGRRGVYDNGYLIFDEGPLEHPVTRWIVKTNNQTYPAQIDFFADGIIETQTHLSHTGHRRIAEPVGAAGRFLSPAAFRTARENVTITKEGPGMLALDGEQSYLPGSRLHVIDGQLRMATNPGHGGRIQPGTGPHLTLAAFGDAHVHLTAPVMQFQQIELRDQSVAWLDEGCYLSACKGIRVGPGAIFHAQGRLEGAVSVEGRLEIRSGISPLQAEDLFVDGRLTLEVAPGAAMPLLRVDGGLHLRGSLDLRLPGDWSAVPDEALLLAVADIIDPPLVTREILTADGRTRFRLSQDENRLWLTPLAD